MNVTIHFDYVWQTDEQKCSLSLSKEHVVVVCGGLIPAHIKKYPWYWP